MNEMILTDAWMVSSSLDICKIIALRDNDEKGTVRRYFFKDRLKEDDDPWEHYWTDPGEFDKFFQTEGDAVNYRNELREELKAKMPEVNRYIRRMDEINPSNDFEFRREDYLAWYANTDDSENYDAYVETREMYYILRDALHRGMLNINAESVKIDEIVAIKWNEERYKNGTKRGGSRRTAPLVMRDKHEVSTRKSSEYEIIKDLFGENRSDRIYVKNVTSTEDDDD